MLNAGAYNPNVCTKPAAQGKLITTALANNVAALQGVAIMASITYADVDGATRRAEYQRLLRDAAGLWARCSNDGEFEGDSGLLCECAAAR